MIKVVLFGSGNVSYHLAKAFRFAKDINLVQLFRKNPKNDHFFDIKIPKIDSLNEIKNADVYILAINDDQIAAFSKELQFEEGLVVHTSGSISLDQLKCKAHKGIFYPLQTFSINQKLAYETIPLCLETEYTKDMDMLKSLARSISNNVYEINSIQREKLHIAAVFTNNFSNHMFKIAKDICDEHKISFDLLKPLILNTANKINYLDPIDAQTGPAKRNDQKVIQKHLEQLQGDKKKIYSLISKSIIKTYLKEL